MRNSRALIAALMLLLVGCEEMVDPVLQTEQSFTLFGFIDPGSPRQAIRVFEIDEVLEQVTPEPLNATVSLSLPGGPQVSFRDSVVTYFDGSIGHVFHAGFQPEFETNYELTVTSHEGREAKVALRTPGKATLVLEPASGVLGNVHMPVSFDGAEQVLAPRVLYTFESTKAPFVWTIPVVYADDVVRTGDRWSVTVDISRDIGVLYGVSGLRPGFDPIVLTEMEIQAFVATAEWTPPTGEFDPNLLVQPGIFSNVQGGFGFVGAGYTESETTLPEAAILRLAGFANEIGS